MKKRSLSEKEEIAVIQALRLSSTLLTMTEYRSMVIEECARVAEEHDVGQGWGDAIAVAIRALKNKTLE